MDGKTFYYLDNAATTALDPRVQEAMREIWAQGFANPASQHQAGRKARRILEQAREEITQLLGGDTRGMGADRLIFTSGGTEANQLALSNAALEPTSRVLISAVEHPSIRGLGAALLQRGCRVETVGVDQNGALDVGRFQSLLATDPQPRLISIMTANNETGALQPIRELAHECRERNICFHTDAAQAIGKIPFHFRDAELDAVTIVPHKFHGPVGIGALLTKAKYPIEPLFHGGFQQGGLRPGTENVALAVGFATALRIAHAEAADTAAHLHQLRHVFESELMATCAPVVIAAASIARAPHISNIAFLGVDRQQLFLALDLAGVACSTGSACASGSSEPSPVLLAMGLSKEVISSALRFSFSRTHSEADVLTIVNRISRCVNQLRRS
jgi:cysteine desulfurase